MREEVGQRREEEIATALAILKQKPGHPVLVEIKRRLENDCSYLIWHRASVSLCLKRILDTGGVRWSYEYISTHLEELTNAMRTPEALDRLTENRPQAGSPEPI